MKNVQVIDGADNCHFPIFQMTDREFKAVFPSRGQDIAFIDDVVRHLGNKKAIAVLTPVWERPVLKEDIVGLHGTLFYEFESKKKYFPRSRRDRDWSPDGLNVAERKLRADKE